MIIENAKFTDVCESIFQRLDEECERASEGMRDAYFAVANCIREQLSADPTLADRMKGKTVKGAYEEMYKAAKDKHKQGGGSCVFIPPEQAVAIIGRYCFGEVTPQAAVSPTIVPAPTPAKSKKEEPGIVDLFDLI